MTPTRFSSNELRAELIEEIEELSGQNLYACYQCGKCSAGCPMAFSMDILPHQVIRLIQLGQTAAVIRSNSFWHCAACLTCTSRCPKGVDLASVMEALRTLVVRTGKAPLQLFPPPVELLTDVPLQAAVSAFRKLSG